MRMEASTHFLPGILCQEYVRHLVKAPTTPRESQEKRSSARRKRSRKAKPSSADDTNEKILPNGEESSRPSHADNEGNESEDEGLPDLGASSWTVNTYPTNPV